MTMAVIAIALALPLLLDVLLQNMRARHRRLEPGVRYLGLPRQEGRPPAGRGVGQTAAARDADVAAVRVITAGEALAEFRDASGSAARSMH